MTKPELDALAESVATVALEEIGAALAPLRQQIEALTQAHSTLSKQIAERGLRYCGVFKDGEAYAPGDFVSWGGHAWCCLKATSNKPGYTAGDRDWQLAVKGGRDGRDLR